MPEEPAGGAQQTLFLHYLQVSPAEMASYCAAVLESKGITLARRMRCIGLLEGKVVPKDEAQGRLDVERACYAGDHLGCRLLSDHLRRSNLAEALIASERGCSLGDAPSCTRAERLHYRLSLQKQ